MTLKSSMGLAKALQVTHKSRKVLCHGSSKVLYATYRSSMAIVVLLLSSLSHGSYELQLSSFMDCFELTLGSLTSLLNSLMGKMSFSRLSYRFFELSFKFSMNVL